MSWTIIVQTGDAFTAIMEFLSHNSHNAWQQAKEKYPTAVGMLKGNHAMTWCSHD